MIKFEDIRHTDEKGNEYWLARELQEVLGYKQWRRFKEAIDRAKEACQRSKQEIHDHFADIGKSVEMPSKAKPRFIADYDQKMSRYACYLTAMNGDPRKEIIALAQTYFAVKTRQQEYQELFNSLTEDDRRLFLRSDIKQKNMLLVDAAKRAGITTGWEYAEFQDHGYMGLYGGFNSRDIAERKKLDPDKQEILDYMGSEELAANLFRITQTESVMRRKKTATPNEANQEHYRVGTEVRAAIERIGGEMPENLPTPEKSTAQIERERINKIKQAGKPQKLKY